ncbi:taurine dioxygenase [Yamadazyma tenuis]|uniref:TauD-domain-containing protein n=1 Tax=Candida tenuis (strain ATCC 10573 / BCRC 21748 / CBS 615 / JCM 9827 / NBRC 10315 / NRRL Y-1498 / VKM Y-70) TaxID=590646 RepID=G3AX96_CANTC|nr:TauD-domain-containing protein [Yamadazyma tenuis ATCC 10573]EGV66724.1 TauD-domain-containing protein [Yamadazyma tenuis ATCC 10573]WEJ95140.1 taurine dioxygenase [Yamadazyma tenuis]
MTFDFKLPEQLQALFPDYHTPNETSPYEYAKAQGVQYPNYTPWKMEPLEEIKDIEEKGKLASKDKSSLLNAATSVRNITPLTGTEILGLSLAKLSDSQKNDLAKLAAERGVVVFRAQDDLDIREQVRFGSYFGPPHIHQESGIIPDIPWVHAVYKDENSHKGLRSQVWHSDVPYELNSAGLTTLRFDTIPSQGGDTMFANGYAIYESLNPGFRAYLETLSAVHSGYGQLSIAQSEGRTTRRPPLETVHPLVRTNPITGLKSLYISENFTTAIVGLEKKLSDVLLRYLFDYVNNALQFQVRLSWGKHDVAVWDNRSHFHTGVFDYYPEVRHGTRVIALANKAYFDPNSKLLSEYEG